MKITIEPTEKQPKIIGEAYAQISVTIKKDHHTLEDIVYYMIIPALVAYGYSAAGSQIKVSKFDQNS